MAYYNTTHLVGHQLALEIDTAKKQVGVVLDLFKLVMVPMSPSQVLQALPQQWPLTSIRRAMTDLAETGMLVKTKSMVTGIYGKPEHQWRLNIEYLEKKYGSQI